MEATQTKQPLVLVVDDDAVYREIICEFVEQIGCQTERACNGKEALAKANLKEYDLFILDIQMPGMDGFELASLLKLKNKRDDQPVIFVSGERIDNLDKLRGYRLGAFDYLEKPMLKELLQSKVQVFLNLMRKEDKLCRQNQDLQLMIQDLKGTRDRLLDKLTDLAQRNSALIHAAVHHQEKTQLFQQQNEAMQDQLEHYASIIEKLTQEMERLQEH